VPGEPVDVEARTFKEPPRHGSSLSPSAGSSTKIQNNEDKDSKNRTRKRGKKREKARARQREGEREREREREQAGEGVREGVRECVRVQNSVYNP